jgi:hypothetical protein
MAVERINRQIVVRDILGLRPEAKLSTDPERTVERFARLGIRPGEADTLAEAKSRLGYGMSPLNRNLTKIPALFIGADAYCFSTLPTGIKLLDVLALVPFAVGLTGMLLGNRAGRVPAVKFAEEMVAQTEVNWETLDEACAVLHVEQHWDFKDIREKYLSARDDLYKPKEQSPKAKSSWWKSFNPGTRAQEKAAKRTETKAAAERRAETDLELTQAYLALYQLAVGMGKADL